MAGANALRRRVARLEWRETADLRAFMGALTRDEWRGVTVALRAAGYPLPESDNPWSLPVAERARWLAALEAECLKPNPERERILRRTLTQLRAQKMAAQDSAQWWRAWQHGSDQRATAPDQRATRG
jgi:hypothetical protein